jgi:cytochrome c oxidase cbb3-type subunit 4
MNTIESFLFDAHSIITLVSFVTFIGIVWWTYGVHRNSDFDSMANLPLNDDIDQSSTENDHV